MVSILDHERIEHSILTVSCAESFDMAVRNSLPAKRAISAEFCKNAASARQRFFERFYDLVIINFPLPDEVGTELAFDIAEKCNASVLIAAPMEVFDDVLERMADYGILVISKPIMGLQLEKAIRLLMTIQEKINRLEQEVRSAQEKTEELRIVSKAKFALMEHKHMTEDEAHRFIGKEAMNHGTSRKRVAEIIIDDLEN